MELYKNLTAFTKSKGNSSFVLTMGVFDGVHSGHKKILQKLLSKSKAINAESVLLTFFPHPKEVVVGQSMKLLNTIEEKSFLLENEGLDHLIIQPFTPSFANLSPHTYILENLVKGIGMDYIIIGYDHKFGKNREGDIKTLQSYSQTYNYIVEEVSVEVIDNSKVSSREIRNSLQNGKIKRANALLGYNYSFEGTVIEGRKVGEELGFPTANIRVEDAYKLMPSEGVYATRLLVDGDFYNGMMNIGIRPTFQELTKELNVEIHIFNLNKNLYGKKIKIEMIEMIREEIKFNNKEELISQLKEDKKQSQKILC